VEFSVRIELNGLTKEMGLDLTKVTISLIMLLPDPVPNFMAASCKVGSKPLGVHIQNVIKCFTAILEFLVHLHLMLGIFAHNRTQVLEVVSYHGIIISMDLPFVLLLASRHNVFGLT
jgi:hypothetical protein